MVKENSSSVLDRPTQQQRSSFSTERSALANDFLIKLNWKRTGVSTLTANKSKFAVIITSKRVDYQNKIISNQNKVHGQVCGCHDWVFNKICFV